jgi:energy-coupling factor transporter transmembrane protein EcfT
MSASWKLALILLGVVLGVYFVAKIVLGLVASLVSVVLSLLVPLLIVGGIAYVLYSLVSRKSLGAGRRRILP